MLYHEPTQRFVMWMHIDTGDYELARCGMATSPSATGKHASRRASSGIGSVTSCLAFWPENPATQHEVYATAWGREAVACSLGARQYTTRFEQ